MNKKVINNINNFYKKASDIQIQQGTVNSFQLKSNGQNFDYKEVLDTIQEIKKYESFIEKEYRDKAIELKTKIEKIEELVQNKENPSGIKTLLKEIRELSNGITSSLVASGIVALLDRII